MYTSLRLLGRTLGILSVGVSIFAGVAIANNRGSVAFGNDIENTLKNNPLHVFMLQENGGNVYAAGQYVFSPANAPKDVLTVGQQINYNHDIGGDGLFAGAQVIFGQNATIYGDLRAAAGQFASAANIKGDLMVAAGNITLDAANTVNGLTVLAGGNVTVQGKLIGNVRIFAGQVMFDAQASKDVLIEAKDIIIGTNASIKGDLSYHAQTVKGSLDEITAGTVTGGIVAMNKSNRANKSNRGDTDTMYFGTMPWRQTMCMISIIVLSLLLYLPLRKVREVHQADALLKTPGLSIVIGLLMYILMPILGVLLMITVIGFPLGLLLLVTYPFLFILAGIVNTCSFIGILHKGLPQSGRKGRVGLVGATIALALLFTHYRGLSILISMRTYGGISQIKRSLLKHISK